MTMANASSQLNDLGRSTAETTARLQKISLDSTERLIALQLDYAKTLLDEATRTAKAFTGTQDVQQLLALRTKSAESAMEKWMGYSRGLYEVASEAQGEISRLAEERLATLQKAVSQSVEEASKSAPAGSEVAVAALKSSMAAATAAFDTFSKAAKHAASFTDAGVKAAGGKARK
jgi:phasin family protein